MSSNQNEEKKKWYSIPLVGRKEDLKAVQEYILRSEVRLLTLTGMPGVGKTRLALQLVNDIQQEFVQCSFVDLSFLERISQVLPAIARSCNVLEGTVGPLFERLTSAIGTRQVLLVLDNCEHVLEAMSQVSNLLEACPNLKIIATSRELLRLKWEWVFPVPPLQIPENKPVPPLSILVKIPAVTLFLKKARTFNASFELIESNSCLVAEICTRLEGIPLAIELAASQTRIIGLKELLERLDTSLKYNFNDTRDMPDRHRTLWSAIDWSYNLLTSQEKTLFQRLAVFSGSWCLQSAEEICDGDGIPKEEIFSLLGRLVDCSLVSLIKLPSGEFRYRFLETIRSYARERLRESGCENHYQQKHRDWFLIFAEFGEPHLWGHGIVAWLDQLELEYANLSSAFEWCQKNPGEAGAGLRLFKSICRFFDARNYYVDGLRIATSLLALAPERNLARSRTLTEAGILARNQGNFNQARLLSEECQTLADELGDNLGSSSSRWVLGSLAQIEGNISRASEFFNEAIKVARSRQKSDPLPYYFSICYLGFFNNMIEDFKTAVALLEEALAFARKIDEMFFKAVCLAWLGQALLGAGNNERAVTVLLEGIQASREIRYFEAISGCIEQLAKATWLLKEKPAAEVLVAAADEIRTQIGVIYWPRDRIYDEVRNSLDKEKVSANRVRIRDITPDKIIDWALSRIRFGAALKPSASVTITPESRPLLSEREQEIVRLIAEGLTNQKIAGVLFLSKRTVDAHVRNILKKLSFVSRSQIANWSARQDISREK